MPSRLRRFIFGAPKDVHDEQVFHKLSLVAMLAWVGLGADGLSSSAYGPDEAFRALVKGGAAHASLAVGLAFGTALTVFIISYAYSRIIEAFPSGGGGYVVATKLLGPRFGLVSGSALLVDYVLTITISIAAGGDALFSLIPRSWFDQKEVFAADGTVQSILLANGSTLQAVDLGTWLDPVQRTKVVIELCAIVLLTILNIRGVKESVTAIVPLFLAFVLTHAVLLIVAIGGSVGEFGAVTHETALNYRSTVASLGTFGALALFVRAYSLGGGTYTGIEAVSNGIQIMREPKVRTAKRTMVLMATSLSITAGGIILAYLLMHVMPVEGQTMNAVLLEKVAGAWKVGTLPVGKWFVLVALVSEAGLLFIAAQAGFLDGPRVMANMAVDSWLPHRFAALSERLSMQNGVLLMSGTSIAALFYTHGNVAQLVVMYSINVFLTFSLSNLAMSRHWITERKQQKDWFKHLPVHLVGLVLCVTILIVTCIEKFGDGGWLTLVITGALVAVCLYIKSHYAKVVAAIRRLDIELPDPLGEPEALLPRVSNSSVRALGSHVDLDPLLPKIDREKAVALLFVGGYGGLGRHALLTLLRMFPEHYKGVVFCSIAIVDSGNFKGAAEVEQLEARTTAQLEKYVRYAATLGLPAEAVFATGIEVAVEAEKIGIELIQRFPRGLFVAGQLIFEEDSTINRALHNETAFMIQRRLQHAGVPMIVLPVRINLKAGNVNLTGAIRLTEPEPSATSLDG
jgi:amino acid transporter